MGNTDVTVDQGGSGGSDALQTDGYPMRRVAAEARRVLLDMASARLRRAGRAARRQRRRRVCRRRSVEEGHLRRVDRRQALQRHADRQQHRRDHRRRRSSRTCSELKIVGTSPQRYDIPAKVDGSLKWAVDVEGARHGARAQREAAGRGREAREHRRVVRQGRARIRQGRQQGQLRRRRVRARRAGDPGGATAESELAEAGDRAVPGVGGSVHLHAQRRRRPRARRRSSSATRTRR